jgi:RimJ/RimL family protein N-acetyltransferase
MTSATGIILRALEEADVERTHRWHNDPELYSTLVSPFRFVSKTAELEWLRRKAAYSANQVNLAICLSPGGEHIGNIYLGEIDWISRRAALGLFIGSPEHRGKGYGKEAMRQLLAHAFRDLHLNRLFLEVLVDNTPAIRLYETCGFRVEGRLCGHVFKNGKYQDLFLMGINSPENSKAA